MSEIENEAWVEAVARALCKDDGWTSRDVAHAWKAYRSLARAAIRALAPLIIERCAEEAEEESCDNSKAGRLDEAFGAMPILREPCAWWAETGTAGRGDGCNRPFWLKHEAVAYVREHGGHVAPLFRSHSCDPADPCSTAYDLASERNTLDGLWAETKDRLDAALAQVARLRDALAAIVARSENGAPVEIVETRNA